MKRILIGLGALVILVVVAALIAVGPWFINLREASLDSGTQHLLEWGERETIETDLGAVTGLSNGQVHAFLGLPYAEPPVRERRFAPPVPVSSWQQEFSATTFPNICLQDDPGRLFGANPTNVPSEDCLYLNVFTPSIIGSSRPVLFWIHGGSFTGGSANEYDGSVLALQGDVVVVAINYRLGITGFLDLSMVDDAYEGSASNGIRDQIEALRWVNKHIESFGGDPGNVTIFGESAGGGSVLSILASPSADGLYHKAIAHSGASPNQSPPNHIQSLTTYLEVEPEDLPSALRRLSAEQLLAVQLSIDWGGGGNIDGIVVTRSSDQAILDRGANGVPLVAGYTRDEGTLFSFVIPWFFYGNVTEGVAGGIAGPENAAGYLARLSKAYPDDSGKERLERVFQDLLSRGMMNSAARASAAGPGGWLYRFDMPLQKIPELGATHGAEIAFTFNNFAGDAPETAFLYDKHDPSVRTLARNWSQTVLQFAKTGYPNGSGLPYWPRYTVETRETLILDSNPRVESFLNVAERERWGDMETASSDFYLP